MSLLEKLRALEQLLWQDELTTNSLAAGISNLLECNTYLIDADGEIIGSALPQGSDCTKATAGKALTIKKEFRQRLDFTFQTIANLVLDNCFLNEGQGCLRPNTMVTLVPIRNLYSTPGHLILTKLDHRFSDEELVLAEAAGLVSGAFLYEQILLNTSHGLSQKANAEMVLNSLSFSELKAISNVLGELKGSEGLLVASKIADRIKISRSVIVNAMRKLESAGVVESRSLGIKGTYIKIKNLHFLEVLKERAKY